MPRLRTLKPGFFENEELAQIEPLGRLLFTGLWCLADREGRLEDRPARIKVQLLAYDDCDINELLEALAAHGFIVRYEIEERSYIQVVNFTKHQMPHYKEAPSTIPAPAGHADSGVTTFGVSREQRARILTRYGNRCVECGTTERLTVDHIVPRSHGGSGDDENLQVLCLPCNARKNNRVATPSEAEVSIKEGRPDVDPTLNRRSPELGSNSGERRVYQSGASPSVFGLPSSVFGLPSLGEEDRSSAPTSAPRPSAELIAHHEVSSSSGGKVRQQFLDALTSEFAPTFGSAQHVRDSLTSALSYLESHARSDPERWVRDWVTKDATRYQQEHQHGASRQLGPARLPAAFRPPVLAQKPFERDRTVWA